MTLLLIIVGALAFVAMAGVGLVLMSASTANQRATRRTQAIVSQKGRTEKSARVAARNTQLDAGQRRKQIVRSLKDTEKRERAARFSITSRLHQAGLNITVVQFWIGAGVFGVVCMALALVTHQRPLIALLVGFVAAAGIPFWLLGSIAKRRRAKFVASFADATDIIVRGIRSGLPLHDCLKIIGKESPEPLAGEFRRLVESMGMGLEMDQALEKAYERMPTPELRFFVIVLNIQAKAGGNLGEALGNLSSVIRGRRMMREKIKALSGEAIASAWIIGALPVIVMALIWLTNHGYLTTMFTDPRGHMMLGVAVLLEAMGVLVMRKMINFKF